MTGVIKKLSFKMVTEKNIFVIRGCVHLIFIVCVVARTEMTESEIVLHELKYSNHTLNKIAEDLCYKFPDRGVCVVNWLSPPQLIQEQPSTVRITNSDKQVHYEISPSKYSQAVIMVSDDEEHHVVHLLEPKYPNEKVRLKKSLNYTFWTVTVFKNGTHSYWREGPTLLRRDKTTAAKQIEPKRNYTVQIDRSYSDMMSCNCSNVTFTWSNFSDSDSMFTVTNICNGGIETNTVRQPNAMEMRYSTLVPLGSKECQFEIEGRSGKGSLLYDIEPLGVKKITLSPVLSSMGWDVHVGWARPEFIPDRYRVVLRVGHEEYTHNVSGKAADTTFRGVASPDQPLYNVSVCAFKGPVCMHESTRALFPTEEIASSSVPVLGSLLAVLLLATMMVSSVFWCRRRRRPKLSHLYREVFDLPSLLYDEDAELQNLDMILPQEDIEDFPKKLFPEIVCEPAVIEDSWEIRPEKLQLHEVIGEGAFGVVRRGTLDPGKAVAVKMLKDYPSRDEVRSFRAEMELMKSVGAHPHVVSLVGCCSGRRPLIVAEYCGRGDLLSYLRCSWDVMVSKRNAKYCNNNLETSNYRNDLFKASTISQELSKLVVNKMYDLDGVCDVDLTYVALLSFCRQIAMGMEFLASNRVVHRDLAARNVLVTSDRTLKIADFGLSRDIYQENQYKQKGNGKMPVKWMALESLTHRIYTTMSDVWSFGIVVWEVVTLGASPYPDVPAARLPRLLRSGYRMPRPNACCKRLYDVMLSCWRGRPRERPTFAELHAELDAMLHCACAEQYLALDLDAELKPDEPRGIYTRLMEFARGKRRRGSGYASPALRPHSNLYSSPPAPNKPLAAPIC